MHLFYEVDKEIQIILSTIRVCRGKNIVQIFPEIADWFELLRQNRLQHVTEIKKVKGCENNSNIKNYLVTDELENEIIKHL